jgi:hypothetical protein
MQHYSEFASVQTGSGFINILSASLVDIGNEMVLLHGILNGVGGPASDQSSGYSGEIYFRNFVAGHQTFTSGVGRHL